MLAQAQRRYKLAMATLHSEWMLLGYKPSVLLLLCQPGAGITSAYQQLKVRLRLRVSSFLSAFFKMGVHSLIYSNEDFVGLDWWTHGRLVNYNQPNPAQSEISNWLIQNPQRLSLATIGFQFNGADVTEDVLQNKSQTLDLWTGKISSSFTYKGSLVKVETLADPDSDTVGIEVSSDLLSKGALGIFFDFPYPTQNKFDAPFVGVFNETDKHTTTLQQGIGKAIVYHGIDATSYSVSMNWNCNGNISRLAEGSHRYVLQPSPGTQKLGLSTTFSPVSKSPIPSLNSVRTASTTWWKSYWERGAFVDLLSTKSADAIELQRRIILSQYLLAVNSASSLPPQGEYAHCS